MRKLPDEFTMKLTKKIRSKLSWMKFKAGLNPSVVRNGEYRKYIPEQYKSVIIFYADFELAWAWRYSKELLNNKKEILNISRRERENVPEIISICEKYNIPITWATVGHLFLEECKRENNVAHKDILRNEYFENDFWEFTNGDWFDDDPCNSYKESPEWYCPDLIKQIQNSDVIHEIGCHTFSHIDCRDEVCTKEVFDSEINECKKNADTFGIDLKTFVHPGHTIGNLENLSKAGFTSYRTNYGNTLGYPMKHISGLWELQGTMELAYRKKWSIEKNIEFYKEIVNRAVKFNSVCVFWFHPSFDKIFLESIFPELLSQVNNKRNEIWITTAGEYVDWLNSNVLN